VARWSVLVGVAPILAGLASCQEGSSGSGAAPVARGDPPAGVRAAYVAASRGEGAAEPPYSLRYDLAWFQDQKIAEVGLGATEFGGALSTSGGTAVVGAPLAFEGTMMPLTGAAYVFVESAGTWGLQQQLNASDQTVQDYFGLSVAVDGDTAVVGAPQGLGGLGLAYVFVRSGTSWTLQQEIQAPSGQTYFGTFLAVSGSTLLIGAGSGQQLGAVYVFMLSGGTWTQQQMLQAGDGLATDEFGTALAFQGSTAIIGSSGANVGANSAQGAAYVYGLSGSTFVLQQKLVASDGAAGDAFARAVALDGTTVLVGAPGVTVGASEGQGAVYVFTQAGGTFTQQQKLVAGAGVSGLGFGGAVVLAGSVALAGSSPAIPIQLPGQVCAFALSGGTWSQTQTFPADDGTPNDGFGEALALDGALALVGAPAATDGSSTGAGAVYVESLLSIPGSTCSGGTDCGSGFCVDGVCCSTTCTEQCQACDVPGQAGTCAIVAGSPHGSRTPCLSSGPGCGGTCDGMNGGACSYPPKGTSCGTTCSDSQETDSTCDGNGTCVVGQPATCRNNLGCDPTTSACNTTCTANADCATGYLCASGTCAPGTLCTDGHTSQGPNGAQDCSPYSCNSVTGACNTAPCTTVDDCTAPNVCDDTGACIAPPDTSALSGGCSVGGTGGDRWPAVFLALPVLGLVRSRASRRGPGRSRPGSRP
jgi:hypothetical protein